VVATRRSRRSCRRHRRGAACDLRPWRDRVRGDLRRWSGARVPEEARRRHHHRALVADRSRLRSVLSKGVGDRCARAGRIRPSRHRWRGRGDRGRASASGARHFTGLNRSSRQGTFPHTRARRIDVAGLPGLDPIVARVRRCAPFGSIETRRLDAPGIRRESRRCPRREHRDQQPSEHGGTAGA